MDLYVDNNPHKWQGVFGLLHRGTIPQTYQQAVSRMSQNIVDKYLPALDEHFLLKPMSKGAWKFLRDFRAMAIAAGCRIPPIAKMPSHEELQRHYEVNDSYVRVALSGAELKRIPQDQLLDVVCGQCEFWINHHHDFPKEFYLSIAENFIIRRIAELEVQPLEGMYLKYKKLCYYKSLRSHKNLIRKVEKWLCFLDSIEKDNERFLFLEEFFIRYNQYKIVADKDPQSPFVAWPENHSRHVCLCCGPENYSKIYISFPY